MVNFLIMDPDLHIDDLSSYSDNYLMNRENIAKLFASGHVIIKAIHSEHGVRNIYIRSVEEFYAHYRVTR